MSNTVDLTIEEAPGPHHLHQPDFESTIVPIGKQDPDCPSIEATRMVFQREYDSYNSKKYGEYKQKVFLTWDMMCKIQACLEKREEPGKEFNAQDKHWAMHKFIIHEDKLWTFTLDKENVKQPQEEVIPREFYHYILQSIHVETGHRSRDEMHKALKNHKVHTGITKDHLMKWVQHCPKCAGPNSNKAPKNYTKRPRNAGKGQRGTDPLKPKLDLQHRVAKSTKDPREVRSHLTVPPDTTAPTGLYPPTPPTSYPSDKALPAIPSPPADLTGSEDIVAGEDNFEWDPSQLQISFGSEDQFMLENMVAWGETVVAEGTIEWEDAAGKDKLGPMDNSKWGEMAVAEEIIEWEDAAGKDGLGSMDDSKWGDEPEEFDEEALLQMVTEGMEAMDD